jgi:hypothetical protein
MSVKETVAYVILELAKEVFEEMNWHVVEVKKSEVLECPVEAYHGKLMLHFQSYIQTSLVGITVTSPWVFSKGHYAKVSELCMRMNNELNLGSFELHWQTGQVCFRVTPLMMGSAEEGRHWLKHCLHLAVAEMDGLSFALGKLHEKSSAELVLIRIPELIVESYASIPVNQN